ncbi:MAG: carbohydrate ABC transporter permease [Clostridia bacterium]|nr:carbohydrate ABC transporter permease [Clostridia bacterium]
MKKESKNSQPKWNRVHPITNVAISSLFIFLALLTLLPLVFVIIISFSSDASVAEKGYSFFPNAWSTAAYEYMWKSKDYIIRSFFNSVGITVVGTCIALVLIATMGYALSRPKFYMKNIYTWMIFIPMLFGGGLLASYMVNTQIYQLRNTYWALILPGACSGWYIIIMRTFFQTTVPDSIIESGKIDGARQIRIFAQLVLPISLPVIATIGLFMSFSYWNAWYGAMLYITSDHRHLYPLQYVLINIQNNIDFMAKVEAETGMTFESVQLPTETFRMALVVTIVLPIACSYPFFQRFFVGGLTIGSVKG